MMKTIQRIFFLIISLIYVFPAFSQNPEWVVYTSGYEVQSLAEEGNYIWIGTTGGLAQIDKSSGKGTFYNTSNSDLPSNWIHSIAIDDSGNKWIGTWWDGLVRFDGNNWDVYNTSNSGLPDNEVHAIAIDDRDIKWIGTHSGGLAKFDGTNWDVYNTSNSDLPDNGILSIAIDSSDNKWISHRQ
jgi:ligand-binding sensor domain-containing protein